MFSEKAFQIAFVVSLCTHGVILFQNPHFNLGILPKQNKKTVLEVSYLKGARLAREYPKVALPKNDPYIDLSAKVITTKMNPAPFIDKENIFKPNNQAAARSNLFTKPVFGKPDIIAVRKKISLPPVNLEKINNPSYISYYQIVREKIRRAAYQNYTRSEVGDVYLSFLILAQGSLKTVRLVEEKSSPSPYLREIALRSIKEASPFPNFPKELDYPELSFNVVISFEIE